MTNQTVRTRLAPSPTGFLHIGTLRTALYCYLLAKKHQGQFILRIEDTDQKREVEGAVENLINSLQSYKLNFDEGPQVAGPHAPYTQSQRLDIYNQVTNDLLKNKHAYRCFCTSEDLEKMREEQKLLKKPPMYDRRCRHLSEEEIQKNLDDNKSFVVRQAIPLNQTVEFKDAVKGRMKFDTNTLDDHVLMKADGFPTYHLAGIVDDWKMGITHIMRGDEWLPSTPKHVLLFQALGADIPTYVHLSLILNKDGTKLSKRKNDVSASSYLEKGYDVDAIINFIALLGWNPGDNREIFSLEELIQEFSLERLQKSGAIFDTDKLNWFNWQWRRRKYLKSITEIAQEMDSSVEIKEPKKGHLNFIFQSPQNNHQFMIQKGYILNNYLPAENHAQNDTQALVHSVLEDKILKEGDAALSNSSFFNQTPTNYNTSLFLHEKMKIDSQVAIQALEACLQNLEEKDFTTPQSIKESFIKIIKDLGFKNGQVLWPTRVALTNEQFSPGVFDIAYVIGFTETINRFKNSIQQLKNL
jgi:glutamyl-tRNA synthetase